MNKEMFIKELEKLNIYLSEDNLIKLDNYKSLLIEYNHKFNLTAITDEEGIYLKHFYDSLYLLTLDEIKNASSILDIGTGAGFPGLVLSIILKAKSIVLLESNTKKCEFLKKVCEELSIENVIIVNERAEDFAKTNREIFDVVTSRAVSNLLVLSEISIPTLKINGYFLPMKSHYKEEVNYSKDKITYLGGQLIDVLEYRLPIENSVRSLIKIKKIKKTDNSYPRDYSKIIKDLKKIQK